MSAKDVRQLAEWEAKRLADYQAHRDSYPDNWYPGEAEAGIRALELRVEENFELIALHEAGHAVVDYATGAHIIFMSLKPEINGGCGQVKVRNLRMALWIHRISRPLSRAHLARECQRYLAGEAAERLAQATDETETLLVQWNGTNQDDVLPQQRYELRETCGVVLDFIDGDVALSRAFMLKQYRRSVELLRERQPALDALIERLRRNRSLVGDDVCAIITAACSLDNDQDTGGPAGPE